jgi:hypothetical protein
MYSRIPEREQREDGEEARGNIRELTAENFHN